MADTEGDNKRKNFRAGNMLADQAWVRVQKKTFTKWCNMHLKKRQLNIDDLEVDLRSGLLLIQLLEILSDKNLGRHEKKPRMRIQEMANMNLVISFVKSEGIRLENIGPNDLVDGNLKLTLGFIWTIIQKFVIADISEGELTAKEALLLWCQRKTKTYDNVNVKNFTSSFADGLAFCALIHVHKPHLIDYNSLSADDPKHNLELAFSVAENELGIPALLDVEDMLEYPDEKSVIAQVAEYYRVFSSSQQQDIAARRIGKLLEMTREHDRMKAEYVKNAQALMDWIRAKIDEFEKRDFENTLEDARAKTNAFGDYKSQERPPKSAEKLELEQLYNNLALKLRSHQRPEFIPPEGLSVAAVQGAWGDLEKSEVDREEALRAELERQEKIARLLNQFKPKVAKLEAWAADKESYLEQREEINSLSAAQVHLKLLESYEQEYEGSKLRVEAVNKLGKQLLELNARESDFVQQKMDAVASEWQELSKNAKTKREYLEEQLAREERKEALRKRWAEMANAFNRWVGDTAEAVGDSHFGDSLETVTAYRSTMDENDALLKSQCGEKMQELETCWSEMQEMGITDNRYTALTIEDERETASELDSALEHRHEEYERELKHQQEMEAKRKEFAAAAEQFVAFLQQDRQAIDAVGGEPDEAIAGVQAHFQEGAAGAKHLADLTRIDTEARQLGVTENRHTEHTLPTLKVANREHAAYVADYVAELREEKALKEAFDKRASTLAEWISAKTGEFSGELESDNTLGGAQARVNEFLNYRTAEKAERAAEKGAVEADSATIEDQLQSSSHDRPAFAPALSVADVQTKWDALEEAEKSREEALYAELRRQERLRELSRRFAKDVKDLVAWIREKKAYLEQSPAMETFTAAQVQSTLLSDFEEEYGGNGQKRLAALRELAAELQSENYSDAAQVQSRLQEVADAFDGLQTLRDSKRAAIDAELARFDAKCKEFAEAADAFLAFVEAHRGEVNALRGEPEPLSGQIRDTYQEGARVAEQLAKAEQLAQELSAMNISKNPHTQLTVPTLKEAAAKLADYVKEYLQQLRYEQEQKALFDRRATALTEWIDETRATYSEPSFDNTLEGAREAVSAFNEYRKTGKASRAADKNVIVSLGANIERRLANSAQPRPDFAPALPVADIESRWASMEALESQYGDAVYAELARQEQLAKLVAQFDSEKSDMNAWADKKEAYLNAEDAIDTLSAMQVQLNVLASFEEELNASQKRLSDVRSLADQIVADNYAQKDRVRSDADQLAERWSKLARLAQEKRARLSSSKFDDHCKAFAKHADDAAAFFGSQKEVIASLGKGHEGEWGAAVPRRGIVQPVAHTGYLGEWGAAMRVLYDESGNEIGWRGEPGASESSRKKKSKRSSSKKNLKKADSTTEVSGDKKKKHSSKKHSSKKDGESSSSSSSKKKHSSKKHSSKKEGESSSKKKSKSKRSKSKKHSEEAAAIEVSAEVAAPAEEDAVEPAPEAEPEAAREPEPAAQEEDVAPEATQEDVASEPEAAQEDVASEPEAAQDQDAASEPEAEPEAAQEEEVASEPEDVREASASEPEDVREASASEPEPEAVAEPETADQEEAATSEPVVEPEAANEAPQAAAAAPIALEDAEVPTVESAEPGPLIEAIHAFYRDGALVRQRLEQLDNMDKHLRSMNILDNKHANHSVDSLRKDARALEAFVRDYLQELEDERAEKENYDQRAAELGSWIEATTASLRELEFDNTLEGAQSLQASFETYCNTQKASHSADLVAVEGYSNNITARLQASKHGRPAFKPARDVASLKAAWAALEEAENARREALTSELARQERLEAQAARFEELTGELATWHSEKFEYLSREESAETITAAEAQRTVLDSFDAAFEQSKQRVQEYHRIGEDLCQDNYRGAEGIREALAARDAEWAQLAELSQAKRVKQDAVLASFDEACKRFAEDAAAFVAFIEQQEAAIDALRGEPAELLQQIDEVHGGGAEAQSRLEALEKQASALALMNVRQNRHTTLAVGDLQRRAREQDNAVKVYKQELREEEEQKKNFDQQASTLSAWLDQTLPRFQSPPAFDNTLEGALQRNAELATFRDGEFAERNAELSALESLSAAVTARLQGSSHERPAFAPPLDAPSLRRRWAELEEARIACEAASEAELKRQRAMSARHRRFEKEASSLASWMTQREQYLRTEEELETQVAARTQLSVLDGYESERERTEPRVLALRAEADGLRDDNFHRGDEVQQAAADAESKWALLAELAAAKRQRLETDRFDAKCKEFAAAAQALIAACAQAQEEVNSLRNSDPAALSDQVNNAYSNGEAVNQKLQTAEHLAQQLVQMNIAENPHTKLTTKDLRARTRSLAQYINDYQDELREETRLKESYNNRASVLNQWIEEKLAELNSGELGNSLPEAQANVAAFQKYRTTEKAERDADDRRQVSSLANQIEKLLSNSSHDRPAFEPELSVAALDARWSELEEAEKQREELIYAELRRQERLVTAAQNFKQETESLEEFAAQKREQLQDSQVAESVTQLQVQVNVLRGIEEELKAIRTRLDKYSALAKQLVDDNFVKADRVSHDEKQTLAKFAELDRLADERRAALESDPFDEKRKEFARAADDFVAFLAERREQVDGFRGEPDAVLAEIEQWHANGEPVAARLAQVEQVDQQLQAMDVTDNPHTKLTVSSLHKKVRELDAYVATYRAQLSDERERKQRYAARAAALLAWCEQTTPSHASASANQDNTLAGARAARAEFDAYLRGERAERSADLSVVADLGEDLARRLEAGAPRREPFAPEVSVEQLRAAWQTLQKAEREREAALSAEMSRQEKLSTLAEQFESAADSLNQWLEGKTQYLQGLQPQQTLALAQAQRQELRGLDNEIKASEEKVRELEQLAEQLAGDQYHEAAEVQASAQQTRVAAAALAQLAAAKASQADEALESAREREALRQQLRQAIKAYGQWTRKEVVRAGDHHFGGDSLAAVQDRRQPLEQQAEQTRRESVRRRDGVQALSHQLGGEQAAPEVAEALALHAQVEEALAGRAAAYEAELERQQASDAKCHAFAEAAAAFVQTLSDEVQALNAVQGEPEERLASVRALYGDGAKASGAHESARALDAEAKALGIARNPHTELTVGALDRKLKAHRSYVARLLASIEQEQALKERMAAAAKELEQKRALEALRVEYARETQRLSVWLEKAGDEATESVRADSAEEVSEAQRQLEEVSGERTTYEPALERLAELASQLEQASAPVKPALQDTRQRWEEALQGLEQRREALATEAERQAQNDRVCARFAEAAAALQQFVDAATQRATPLGAGASPLEEELKVVEQLDAERASQGQSHYQAMQEAHAAVREARVQRNPHTQLAEPQLRVEWNQLEDTLRAKRKLIEEELLAAQGSKATPEQLAEYRESYNMFDKDRCGLNEVQFKGVLMSLGEEADDASVAKIFKSLDSDGSGRLGFGEFSEFMLNRNIDHDSQEQIEAAFGELCGGADFITESQLRAGLSTDEVDYLLANMPPVDGQEGAYDYKAYVASVY